MTLHTRHSVVLSLALIAPALIDANHRADAGGLPQNPDYRIVIPSNTGIPGHNEMLFVTFGPDGRLWTSGRDAFWGQGGVAALDFATGLWKTYSSAETPLNQWCYAMEFAADGSAWIASEDVVAHLHSDGETMTGYTSANSGVLVGGRYEAIDIAPDGHVWAANPGEVDLGGGLFEFNGEAWIKHEEPWMVTWTGFGFAPPLNVIARSNGDVIARFLSSPGCMGRYRNGQWMQITNWPLMIGMVESSDGTLYGVSASATYRFNDSADQWEQIGSEGGSRIALDPVNNFIYIKSDLYTVMQYDGKSWSIFATYPGWVDAIGVAPNGDVWITAEAWLSHYDLHHYTSDGQLLRVYNRSNTGMITYFGPGMYLDNDGMMWFMDGEYGASRLEPNENWRNFGVYNGQEEVYPFWVSPVGMPWWQTPGADFWTESVDQVFHDSQGNFWLRGPNIIARSHGDNLSQWDTWAPGTNGMPFDCASVGEDAEGNIWLGTFFVAYRLDGNTWTEVPIGIPGQFAAVHGWTIAPDGSLWVARVGTFYRWENNAFVPVLELPVNIGEFQFAPSGDLWIATGDGLYRWDGTDFTIYTPNNSALAELAVVSIDIRDSDGVVVAATSQQSSLPYDGGVALFDPAMDEWVAYNYGESFLPFYAPGHVRFDAEGDVWIAMLNFGAVQVFVGDQTKVIPGDIDGDGDVDFDDFTKLLASWGPCTDCPADLDGDGDVDFDDFTTLLANWS